MENAELIEGLNRDLAQERHAIKEYARRLQQAAGVWALGLKNRLERIIAEETDHERRLLDLLGKSETDSSGIRSGKLSPRAA